MNKEYFENCNKLANNNLNNKGNLSEFLKSYLVLAQSLGLEQIASAAIVELPPSTSFNNPDPRVDVVVSLCEQSLSNVKENVSMVR
jgi:hypothetical protein